MDLNLASYIPINFLAVQKTPTPRKFQFLLWREYGYFVEMYNLFAVQTTFELELIQAKVTESN